MIHGYESSARGNGVRVTGQWRLGKLNSAFVAGLTLGTAPIAQSLLFGVRPTDPVTLGAAIGVIAIVSVFSSVLPAMRAARLDPPKALADR